MADLLARLLDFTDRHPVAAACFGLAVAAMITGSIETPH